MRVLICNDDSVHASGIKALKDSISEFADVKVVAPLEEKSTTGHSLTLHKPLRLLSMGNDIYGVSGSPADCVQIGISQVFKKKPDLVISGINRGANLGQDVYYSGTVSAAREACMHNIPALAVSLCVDFYKKLPESKLHYETAAHFSAYIVKNVLAQNGKFRLPKHTLLNLNVPDLPKKKVKGIRLARQGFRIYSSEILKRVDHRGKDYFWVGGGYEGFIPEQGTDCDTVEKGYVALTPLQLDCTHHTLLVELSEQWNALTSKKT